MNFTIFNVDHGFAGLAQDGQGSLLLFDCGHNQATGFRPSSYLRSRSINRVDRLVVSHADEDHVSDLPELLARTAVNMFHRNRSLTPAVLRQLKAASGPLGPGVRAFLALEDSHVTPEEQLSYPPVHPAISLQTYCHTYPTFHDTNNLSLVSFVDIGNLHLVLPGDLESDGWREHLKNEAFARRLARVNIFVASHHGRRSGYFSEVFDYCRPQIIVVADGAIQYDSQLVRYAQHAGGVPWDTGETRYVLTTRCDGHIKCSSADGDSFRIVVGGL